MSDLFDAIKGREDFRELLEAIRALEQLTGTEIAAPPDGIVTVTHAEAPHALQEGERVVFHFGGGRAFHFARYWPDVRDHDVVIEIFDRFAVGNDAPPVCGFVLCPSYKERGDLYTPVKVMMGKVCVSIAYDIRSDSMFYRYLAGRYERAAVIFSHMWRLQRGPMVLGNDGCILGTVWS